MISLSRLHGGLKKASQPSYQLMPKDSQKHSKHLRYFSSRLHHHRAPGSSSSNSYTSSTNFSSLFQYN